MNRAGCQLFAGIRLAADVDRCLAPGELADLFPQDGDFGEVPVIVEEALPRMSSNSEASGEVASLRQSADFTSSLSFCRSTGFETKSKAPALSALMAVSVEPWAVMIATGIWLKSAWMCSTSSIPLPSGNFISVRQRLNVFDDRAARALLRSTA